MSVLIKGMDMPDSCRHCCMMTGTFCDVLNIDVDPYYDGAKHRNVCCPLVKLPKKHGRLIDENDIIDAIHARLNELQTHKEFIKKHSDIDLLGVLPYIAKTQTIIEAEGEG